jgi:hypothetical protein
MPSPFEYGPSWRDSTASPGTCPPLPHPSSAPKKSAKPGVRATLFVTLQSGGASDDVREGSDAREAATGKHGARE